MRRLSGPTLDARSGRGGTRSFRRPSWSRLAPGDAALAATLPALSCLSLVGTALAPTWLATDPLLVAALAPRYPFLAVAAADSGLLPFLAVGFVRLAAADGPNFLLARRHGHRVRDLAARWRPTRLVDHALARLFERFGLVLVACSPTGKVVALAGAARLPGGRVAAADAAGTLAQLAVLYGAANSPATVVAATAVAVAAIAAVTLSVIAVRRWWPDLTIEELACASC